MIEVSQLTKDFALTRALDGISFRIEPGEIVGFLGPNGAGKSTTLRILTGYLPATRGRAEVAGFDVFRQSLEVRKNLGYLPENVPLYPELKVREYLRFRGRLKGVPRKKLNARIDELKPQCGLSEVIEKRIGALSRGYRQRVGFADALIAEPPVLILDEPTTGLDPIQRIEMKKLVQSLAPKQTILFSSHILPEVESVCGRVIMIHRGKIVADGKPDELVVRMGGENRYRVEIVAPAGSHLAIQEEIKKLPDVSSVSPVSKDGVLCLGIESNKGTDPRQALFQLAVQKGWSLSELARDSMSLEEVFAKLTFGGEELAS